MPVPEWRLPPVIVGGVSFAIGLFWFGWTGFDPSIHWIAPTLSGLCTGFGIMSIFLQCLNYLIVRIPSTASLLRDQTTHGPTAKPTLCLTPIDIFETLANTPTPIPGCLPHVRSVRHRSKYLPAIPGRRRVPTFRYADDRRQ